VNVSGAALSSTINGLCSNGSAKLLLRLLLLIVETLQQLVG
jgi:hypothetical protein